MVLYYSQSDVIVIIIINVSLGVQGDTGDPGVRGPRGLTGKIDLFALIYRYGSLVLQT